MCTWYLYILKIERIKITPQKHLRVVPDGSVIFYCFFLKMKAKVSLLSNDITFQWADKKTLILKSTHCAPLNRKLLAKIFFLFAGIFYFSLFRRLLYCSLFRKGILAF